MCRVQVAVTGALRELKSIFVLSSLSAGEATRERAGAKRTDLTLGGSVRGADACAARLGAADVSVQY